MIARAIILTKQKKLIVVNISSNNRTAMMVISINDNKIIIEK